MVVLHEYGAHVFVVALVCLAEHLAFLRREQALRAPVCQNRRLGLIEFVIYYAKKKRPYIYIYIFIIIISSSNKKENNNSNNRIEFNIEFFCKKEKFDIYVLYIYIFIFLEIYFFRLIIELIEYVGSGERTFYAESHL